MVGAEQAGEDAADRAFPPAFRSDQEKHLLLRRVAAEDVADDFLERRDRGVVVAPEFMQKRLPPCRLTGRRLEGERQAVMVKEHRAMCRQRPRRDVQQPVRHRDEFSGGRMDPMVNPARGISATRHQHDGAERIEDVADFPLRRRERLQRWNALAVDLHIDRMFEEPIAAGAEVSGLEFGPLRPVPGIEIAAMVAQNQSGRLRVEPGDDLPRDQHRLRRRWEDEPTGRLRGGLAVIERRLLLRVAIDVEDRIVVPTTHRRPQPIGRAAKRKSAFRYTPQKGRRVSAAR